MPKYPGAFCVLFAALMLWTGQTMARPDMDPDRREFSRSCQNCHSLKRGEVIEGPSLAGVFGRRAGSLVEFNYSDTRDPAKAEALPFDMEHVDPSQEELDTLDEMRFVRQLQSIGIGANRLQYAKRDFYRASAQRSQWARQNLLFDGEVGRFDRILIEERQPRFAQMCDGLAKGCQEPALREAVREPPCRLRAHGR